MRKPTVSSDSDDAVAQDVLRGYVAEIESCDDRIKSENEHKSEIYKAAKLKGFDVKVLRKVVAERRKDQDARAEQDAIFELYWNAVHGLAHAHVENIDEFGSDDEPDHDADGVITEHESVEAADQSAGGHGDAPLVPPAETIPPQPEPAGLPEAAASGDNSEPPAGAPATGEAAHPQTSPVVAFRPRKPLRPYCLHQDDLSKCAGQGTKHCFTCERAHQAGGMVQVPHAGSIGS
jgi:uncharacterized protein (UPF0335 family)